VGKAKRAHHASSSANGWWARRDRRAFCPPYQVTRPGKSPKTCPAPFRKIFRFLCRANSSTSSPRPFPARGADRESSRTRDGMRWTRQRRRAEASQGRSPVSDRPARRRTKETVKTIARGKPGGFRRNRGDYRVHFLLHTGCGCSGHPAFPAPSVIEGHAFAKLARYMRRDREAMFRNADTPVMPGLLAS
jgi:hypothetical protein